MCPPRPLPAECLPVGGYCIAERTPAPPAACWRAGARYPHRGDIAGASERHRKRAIRGAVYGSSHTDHCRATCGDRCLVPLRGRIHTAVSSERYLVCCGGVRRAGPGADDVTADPNHPHVCGRIFFIYLETRIVSLDRNSYMHTLLYVPRRERRNYMQVAACTGHCAIALRA